MAPKGQKRSKSSSDTDSPGTAQCVSPDPLDLIESSHSSFEPSSSANSSDEDSDRKVSRKKRSPSAARMNNSEDTSTRGDPQKIPKERVKRRTRNVTENDTDDSEHVLQPRKIPKKRVKRRVDKSNLSHPNLTCDDDLDVSLDVDLSSLPDLLRDKIDKLMDQFKATPELREKLAYIDIELSDIHPNHRMVYGLMKSDIVRKPGVRTDAFDAAEISQIQENWKDFCEEYDLDPKEDLIPFLPDPFTKWNDPQRALSQEQKIKFCQYIAQKLPKRHPIAVYQKFLSMYWFNRKGEFTTEENELIQAWYKHMPNTNMYSILSRILRRRKNNIYGRLCRVLGKKRLHDPKSKNQLSLEDDWALGDPDTNEYPDWVYDQNVWDNVAAESKIDKKKLMRDYLFYIYPTVRSSKPIPIDNEIFQRQVIRKLVRMKPKTWDDPDWEKLGRCNNIGDVAAYGIVRKVTKKHVPKDEWFDMEAVCDTLKKNYLRRKPLGDNSEICLKESSADLRSPCKPSEKTPVGTAEEEHLATNVIDEPVSNQGGEIEETGEEEMEITLVNRSNNILREECTEQEKKNAKLSDIDPRDRLKRNLHFHSDSDRESENIEEPENVQNSPKHKGCEQPRHKVMPNRTERDRDSEELQRESDMKGFLGSEVDTDSLRNKKQRKKKTYDKMRAELDESKVSSSVEVGESAERTYQGSSRAEGCDVQESEVFLHGEVVNELSKNKKMRIKKKRKNEEVPLEEEVEVPNKSGQEIGHCRSKEHENGVEGSEEYHQSEAERKSSQKKNKNKHEKTSCYIEQSEQSEFRVPSGVDIDGATAINNSCLSNSEELLSNEAKAQSSLKKKTREKKMAEDNERVVGQGEFSSIEPSSAKEGKLAEKVVDGLLIHTEGSQASEEVEEVVRKKNREKKKKKRVEEVYTEPDESDVLPNRTNVDQSDGKTCDSRIAYGIGVQSSKDSSGKEKMKKKKKKEKLCAELGVSEVPEKSQSCIIEQSERSEVTVPSSVDIDGATAGFSNSCVSNSEEFLSNEPETQSSETKKKRQKKQAEDNELSVGQGEFREPSSTKEDKPAEKVVDGSFIHTEESQAMEVMEDSLQKKQQEKKKKKRVEEVYTGPDESDVLPRTDVDKPDEETGNSRAAYGIGLQSSDESPGKEKMKKKKKKKKKKENLCAELVVSGVPEKICLSSSKKDDLGLQEQIYFTGSETETQSSQKKTRGKKTKKDYAERDELEVPTTDEQINETLIGPNSPRFDASLNNCEELLCSEMEGAASRKEKVRKRKKRKHSMNADEFQEPPMENLDAACASSSSKNCFISDDSGLQDSNNSLSDKRQNGRKKKKKRIDFVKQYSMQCERPVVHSKNVDNDWSVESILGRSNESLKTCTIEGGFNQLRGSLELQSDRNLDYGECSKNNVRGLATKETRTAEETPKNMKSCLNELSEVPLETETENSEKICSPKKKTSPKNTISCDLPRESDDQTKDIETLADKSPITSPLTEGSRLSAESLVILVDEPKSLQKIIPLKLTRIEEEGECELVESRDDIQSREESPERHNDFVFSPDQFGESEQISAKTAAPNSQGEDVEIRGSQANKSGEPETLSTEPEEDREVVTSKINSSNKSVRPSRNLTQRDIESWLKKQYIKTKQAEDVQEDGTPPNHVILSPVKEAKKTPGLENNVAEPTGAPQTPILDRLKEKVLPVLEDLGLDHSPSKYFEVTKPSGVEKDQPKTRIHAASSREDNLGNGTEDIAPKEGTAVVRRLPNRHEEKLENAGHAKPQTKLYTIFAPRVKNTQQGTSAPHPEAPSQKITPPLSQRLRKRPGTTKTNTLRKPATIVSIPARPRRSARVFKSLSSKMGSRLSAESSVILVDEPKSLNTTVPLKMTPINEEGERELVGSRDDIQSREESPESRSDVVFSPDQFGESEQISAKTAAPNTQGEDVEMKGSQANESGEPETLSTEPEEDREVVTSKINSSKISVRPSRNLTQREIESWLKKQYIKTKEAEDVQEDGTPPIHVILSPVKEAKKMPGLEKNVAEPTGTPQTPILDRLKTKLLPVLEDLRLDHSPSKYFEVTKPSAIEKGQPKTRIQAASSREDNLGNGTEDIAPKESTAVVRRLPNRLEEKLENTGHAKPQTKLYTIFAPRVKNTQQGTSAPHPEAPSQKITPPLSQRLRKRPGTTKTNTLNKKTRFDEIV